MFICANKWRLLFLVLCLLIVCDSWPPRRRRRRGSSNSERRRKFLDTENEPIEQVVAPEASSRMYTEAGKRLYGGDMVLDKDQVRNIKKRNRRRKAVQDVRNLWPESHVTFAFAPSSETDREVILQAIEEWQTNTCVTFEEIPYYGPITTAHIIFRKLLGCYSNVGMSTESAMKGQTLSIGRGCEHMGIVAHEIGHALGFYHEQSRPDWEDYIKFYPENVKDNMLDNFDIIPNIKYYGVPYDYDSIMHFTLDAFTKNMKNTLVAKDFSKTFKIGQRQHLSFLDLKLANTMYNCSGHCTDEIACDHEGFVDKNCHCVCPPRFEGDYCQFTVPVDKAMQCGGIIKTEKMIATPNYPYNYPAGVTCVWEIESGPGERVRVTFNQFLLNFVEKKDRRCYFDVVEVRRGPDFYDGEKYCGDELRAKDVVSEENKMIILFHSRLDLYPGFMATIRFEPETSDFDE